MRENFLEKIFLRKIFLRKSFLEKSFLGKSIVVIFAAVMSVLTASAQEAFDDVPTLAERISNLENKTSVLDKIRLSGWSQIIYTADDNNTSTFQLHRARLFIGGDIYNGRKGAKAEFRIQTEFAGTPKLVDLWIRYRPTKAFGVQLGQFKFPLLMEFTDNYEVEVIDFALAIQRLQRVGPGDITGISSTGRDIGLQFYGDIISHEGRGLLSYNLAVLNGNGINTRDNNKSKDVVGRLILRPTKRLTLTAYYLRGEANFSTPELMERFGNVSSPKHTQTRRYGGGAHYAGQRLSLRAEYIRAKTGRLHSEGGYLLAQYALTKKFAVAGRLDYFDDDVYTRADEQHYVAGLNYKPWPMLLLQLNYTHKRYEYTEQDAVNMMSLMATVRF